MAMVLLQVLGGENTDVDRNNGLIQLKPRGGKGKITNGKMSTGDQKKNGFSTNENAQNQVSEQV